MSAVFLGMFAGGAMPSFAQSNRISGAVDSARRTSLVGHVHPQARAEFDRGAADPTRVLDGMSVTLRPSAAQQSDLDQLLAAQQDPASPNYHRWLTPEQFADRFGASTQDIARLIAWLEQQNLKVTSVARAHNSIAFTGTVAQVERAFQIQIHRFDINGESHIANTTEPSIPQALAPVVAGVRGLNDFRLKPMLKPRGAVPASASPEYTSSKGNHYISPDDFRTIYDLKPLYNAGVNGSGQTMVVAGQTQINLSDIEQFRTQFGLPANDPRPILVPNTVNPGISSNDLAEADLDLEWSGAVAPDASITFVYSSDVMTSIQYAIDQNLAPVISTSYGSCEPQTPKADALTFRTWAQQANAEGITWFAAAGDSGGADCISGTSTANAGLAVDVPAAIPEVTGLGGTEFNETSGQYWSSTNNAGSGSALSYIPETVWNDSTAGNPAAGGGGTSVYFTEPTWQTGAGVPNNHARNVPDVSLAASADHDGFLVYTGGSLQVYGGTSIAAPSFAAIAVLLNQVVVSNGAQSTPGLGNMNPKLYSLAQTTPSAFHDTTAGNNIVTVTCSARSRACVPGSYGYSAGVGYDQASGLGSVDAANLVNAWGGSTGAISKTTPAVVLTSNNASILSTGSLTLVATITGSNGVTPLGSVAFVAGVTVLGTAVLSGSNGVATASLPVSGAQLAIGTNTILVQYNGNSSYTSATASITIQVSSAGAPPSISSVTNGASFRVSAAPGMLISVFGANLAPSSAGASSVPLPQQMAGVSATLNGLDAPILYVSPGQLNLQVPYQIAAGSTPLLVVNNNGQTASQNVLINAAAPGIFTDQNGALVPTNTAAQGQEIAFFITGAGAVSPAVGTGAAPAAGTALSKLPVPIQNVSVTIGGQPATIDFIGIPAGLVGVVQINVTVPPSAPSGAEQVVVKVGSVSSPPATLNVTR